ncbi:M56 family metallopeptidase [uncultured Aquimarina sp.]|uniref:M56 family metallopeptidase n=1 Tax=uncultured Aquimarina sp. TaxID=575652 RepID=UPI002626D890|nr:M56 family metallopeptidase [uncultured Aquimarina sp.]
MIAYIIKSSLCLMLLWVFYKLFLEKENIHFVKRFYLLFSLVFALIIPSITLTYEVEVITHPEIISEITTPLIIVPDTEITRGSVDYLPTVLWSIYAIGVLVFGFRFVRNILVISKKIRANERLKEPSHINVLLSSSIIPHTFLSYIFVPKKEFQNKNIPEEVLLHEKTHALQKHTLDILFVEVLQVIFWFNPLFIFIKRSIKLNHEFLADQNVLKQRFSIQNYFNLLLNYPNSSNQAVLSSPINYSLTKKRLQMMTKEFSKKRTMLKLVTLVPVLSLCVLFFNNEIVAKEVERSLDEIRYPDVEKFHTLEKSSIIVLRNDEKTAISETAIQEAITKEMIKEYNVWAKDLNAKIKGSKQITIRKNEVDRMEYIYKNMTSDQRKGAEQFPEIPSPPPAPKVMKGEKSDIPPPAKAPKVKKGEKSNIPLPPPPPAPKENWTEQEKEEVKEQVENELARERAEVERERAEIEREEAMLRVEEAENAQELASELAMLNAEKAREAAENARANALEASQEARLRTRNRSRESMREAEMQARKIEKEMRKAEMEARKNAMEVELEARKAMRKAEMQARKAEMEARKSARKAEMKARQAEHRAMQAAENHSPDKLIERMAEKNADFYYNGKQISAKEALKLVEDSNNNLSIDASTKNGKSKVRLKD